jgi:two-component system sensor histidine kinase KdpD
MAPGVGKTYEMLSAAARKAADGVDVAVGLVETHGRRETEALLDGLEVLPRRPIDHRGHVLMEFDLDAALARRPGLLLVDEYAHSNAPGSRHPKRWQDVEELLTAGIDVWTTLNVQHLESLMEVVWRITGVRQQETVPDLAFARADAIEVVDITPEELRERLSAGKVYVPETARLASDRFFKLENLTALRELALRRAAQTVDDALIGQMRRSGIEGPWAAGERILVLIGGDPLAASLVRAGRRLADMMDARWTVLHVERPNQPTTVQTGAPLAAAFKLAEQLGASTVTITSDDLPSALLQYASRNNITQLVIGRVRSAPWRAVFGRSLAHVLLERTQGVALHVITDTGPVEPLPKLPRRMHWTGYATAVATVLGASAVAAAIDRVATGANLAMVFLLAVLATGLTSGFGPSLLAATLAAVSYNFFFLDPRLSFVIGHATDLFTFAIFFVVALIAGSMAGRLRDQASATSRRAAAIGSLLTASRRLAAVATRKGAASALAEQAAASIGGSAVVLLPENGELKPGASAPEVAELSTGAMAAARWAFEKGEAAGGGTGTLPQAGWTFWPLQGLRARVGVAGVEAGKVAPASEGERLLLALLDQGAVGLERAELASAEAEAKALRRSDKLRAALLNSISHDLRTPLSTVLGAATTLLDYGDGLKPELRRELLDSIRDEADRLARYVGDLLDMTRLEGGGLTTRMQPTDVRDVLATAIERVERHAGGRSLKCDFPPDLSLVEADPVLLEQALVNILENAIRYSPDDTAIDVAAYEDRSNVVISIEDEGVGIPTAELERVFDKFRRIEQPSDRGEGIGLGLAISKGFVEAQGGRIAAASPIHGDPASGMRGTRVLISLPKRIATHHMLL